MKKIIPFLVILFVSACSSTHSPQTRETYIFPGETFPFSALTDINGDTVILNDPKQRKLILLFATWCHDSQRTIKHILASDLSTDPKLQIIGIGREENAQSLTKFQQEYQVSFPLVSDENEAIYQKFANTGMPRLLLLNEQNQLVKALVGEDQRTIDRIVW